jgi:hypothetical protein
MHLLKSTSLVVLFGVALFAPIHAEEPQQGEHATTDIALATGTVASTGISLAADTLLVTHEATIAQQRADLAALLAHPGVRDLARLRGVDMDQVEAAAASLSEDQLSQVAPLVSKATPLVQRNMGTVTISVAALIIALLILILIT